MLLQLCRLLCGKPPAFRYAAIKFQAAQLPEAKPLIGWKRNGKPEAFRKGGGKAVTLPLGHLTLSAYCR
jgi:hypothetical protein